MLIDIQGMFYRRVLSIAFDRRLRLRELLFTIIAGVIYMFMMYLLKLDRPIVLSNVVTCIILSLIIEFVPMADRGTPKILYKLMEGPYNWIDLFSILFAGVKCVYYSFEKLAIILYFVELAVYFWYKYQHQLWFYSAKSANYPSMILVRTSVPDKFQILIVWQSRDLCIVAHNRDDVNDVPEDATEFMHLPYVFPSMEDLPFWIRNKLSNWLSQDD